MLFLCISSLDMLVALIAFSERHNIASRYPLKLCIHNAATVDLCTIFTDLHAGALATNGGNKLSDRGTHNTIESPGKGVSLNWIRSLIVRSFLSPASGQDQILICINEGRVAPM